MRYLDPQTIMAVPKENRKDDLDTFHSKGVEGYFLGFMFSKWVLGRATPYKGEYLAQSGGFKIRFPEWHIGKDGDD